MQYSTAQKNGFILKRWAEMDSMYTYGVNDYFFLLGKTEMMKNNTGVKKLPKRRPSLYADDGEISAKEP